MTEDNRPFLTRADTAAKSSSDDDQALNFAVAAARRLDEFHCEDIVIFDVTGISPVTRYIVIATGTSDRQIKSLGAEVGDIGEAHGYERFGSDRDGLSTWLVLDHIDVVVHLFEPETRSHYDLEMLWGDAPKVDWTPD